MCGKTRQGASSALGVGREGPMLPLCCCCCVTYSVCTLDLNATSAALSFLREHATTFCFWNLLTAFIWDVAYVLAFAPTRTSDPEAISIPRSLHIEATEFPNTNGLRYWPSSINSYQAKTTRRLPSVLDMAFCRGGGVTFLVVQCECIVLTKDRSGYNSQTRSKKGAVLCVL
jgi:hypothetical protein